MYEMAAYCRLSKDDGKNKASESIENQIKIIEDYVERAGDMVIKKIYADDGYSGLYFDNRPNFQNMMQDIYEGKINGVITKDISRLGRDHIETSRYIERIFPLLNIRYIAILDNVDSLVNGNEELMQIRTVFNDMYSRDISKKIKGALNAQKKQGNYMSGFAPFGYVKNPENKHAFVIDEVAAFVVRKIFDMYLQGMPVSAIANRLNEENILTPSQYKRNVQNLCYYNPNAQGIWTYQTVRAILKNSVYTGKMVQHKTERVSYKIKKCREVQKENQIIVKNTHEAIISEETFNFVQEMLKKNTNLRGKGPGHKYSGIVFCGQCKGKMYYVESKDGYICSNYHRYGKDRCCHVFIRETAIDDIVAMALRQDINKEECSGKNMFSSDKKMLYRKMKQTVWYEKIELERLNDEYIKMQNYIKKNDEVFGKSIVTKEEHDEFDRRMRNEKEEIRKTIFNLYLKKKKRKQIMTVVKNGDENIIVKLMKKGVAREEIIELVSRIYVYKDKKTEIIFKYLRP